MLRILFITYFHRKSPKTPTEKEKAGKKPRVWELGGSNKDLPILDRSKDKPEDVRSDFTLNNEVGVLLGRMRLKFELIL